MLGEGLGNGPNGPTARWLDVGLRSKNLRDVDERIQVCVLEIEGNEVEEAYQAARYDCSIAEKAQGEHWLGRPPSLVVDEANEDERADNEHGDDLPVVPLECSPVDLVSEARVGQPGSAQAPSPSHWLDESPPSPSQDCEARASKDRSKTYESEGKEEARPSTGEKEESKSVEVDEVVKSTTGDRAAVLLGDLSIGLV